MNDDEEDALTGYSGSTCGSDSDPANQIYNDTSTLRIVYEILKVAFPAMVSSVLGQVTYVINMIYAGKLDSETKTAGLGLGHSISQSLGVMIFLGLNSALATHLSQAYGRRNLDLCGRYMNQMRLKNLCLFVPVAILLANMGYILDLIGQDEGVTTEAVKFLWASLPHIFFTQLFDIQKH